jgi:hypothetical protein
MSTKIISTNQAIRAINRQLRQITEFRDRCVAFESQDDQGWKYVTIHSVGQNKVFVAGFSPFSKKSYLEIPDIESDDFLKQASNSVGS